MANIATPISDIFMELVSDLVSELVSDLESGLVSGLGLELVSAILCPCLKMSRARARWIIPITKYKVQWIAHS